jgi:hypothetical protein
MTSQFQSPESAATETKVGRFFSGAIRRMLRFLVIISVVCTVLVIWRFGLPSGVGFGAGALTAYLSFHSLHKAVKALADRVVQANGTEPGFYLVSRFMLRYLLAGVVAYVIFTSSSQAFRGFLFGLCTPVAAMLVEAGCEAYMGLRRSY